MKLIDVPNGDDCGFLFNELMPRELQLHGQSVLQCGARPGGGWKRVFDGFKRNGYDTFHILEIHEPNVHALKPKVQRIVHGDIRLIDTYNELEPKYDVVIFWHGIEHIHKNELYLMLTKLMTKVNKAFIAGMPWGVWKQGDIKNNPHEVHVSHWYPEELEQFGFSPCVTFNARDKKPGPDNHNVMFGVLFKDAWQTCKAHTGKISFKN